MKATWSEEIPLVCVAGASRGRRRKVSGSTWADMVGPGYVVWQRSQEGPMFLSCAIDSFDPRCTTIAYIMAELGFFVNNRKEMGEFATCFVLALWIKLLTIHSLDFCTRQKILVIWLCIFIDAIWWEIYMIRRKAGMWNCEDEWGRVRRREVTWAMSNIH